MEKAWTHPSYKGSSRPLGVHAKLIFIFGMHGTHLESGKEKQAFLSDKKKARRLPTLPRKTVVPSA